MTSLPITSPPIASPPVTSHATTTRALARGVLRRSFAITASLHPQGMQNIGFLTAIYPALRRLYPDDAACAAACRRHLAYFNTQPYVAALLLGASVNLEARTANGDLDPTRVTHVKTALAPPLAAIGDNFFWFALKPLASAAAAALAFADFPLTAALLFVTMFNVPHLWVRVRGFHRGLELGDSALNEVIRWRLPLFTERARVATQVALGAAITLLAGAPLVSPALFDLLAPFALASLLIAIMLARLATDRVTLIRFTYLVALIAITVTVAKGLAP